MNIDQDCCGTRIVSGGDTLVWVGGIDSTFDGRSRFEVTTPGMHTINVWMREDGQIVDKFLITTEPNFIPGQAGPPESPREGGVQPAPKFDQPTIQGGNITISWTGMGTLEQADAVTGPWSSAPSQSNPQTISATGAAKFFRLKR